MADQAKAKPKFATVKLDEPIVRGEEKIAELTLRKPNAGELRGISLAELLKMDASAVLAVLPRITVPPLIDSEAAQLDPADLFACAVEVSSFFLTREERAAAFPTT